LARGADPGQEGGASSAAAGLAPGRAGPGRGPCVYSGTAAHEAAQPGDPAPTGPVRAVPGSPPRSSRTGCPLVVTQILAA